MAEQALMPFGNGEAFRQEVATICQTWSLPTAFHIILEKQTTDKPDMAKQALATFRQLRREAAQTPEMTLDEINEEIEQARRNLRVACK